MSPVNCVKIEEKNRDRAFEKIVAHSILGRLGGRVNVQMNKVQAEMLRICLASGLLDMKGIVAWADEKIALGSNDFDYVKVSLSKSLDDLATVLGGVQGEINGRELVHSFLCELSRHLERNPNEYEQVIRTAYHLLKDYRIYMNESEVSSIYSLDEGYDLALEGTYRTLDSISQELSLFLQKYKTPESELLGLL